MSVSFEIRKSSVGPEWRAIYRIEPDSEDHADWPPNGRLLIVLPAEELPALTATLKREEAAGG